MVHVVVHLQEVSVCDRGIKILLLVVRLQILHRYLFLQKIVVISEDVSEAQLMLILML